MLLNAGAADNKIWKRGQNKATRRYEERKIVREDEKIGRRSDSVEMSTMMIHTRR